MATNIQDYSPIDSLQKMVDTIPVNNVNSSGSEKEKKKPKKQKKETIAAPPPPPSTLLQLQTTSGFRPNELLKEMGLIFLRQIIILIQSCHPQRLPLWTRNSMTSTAASSIHASWNYFKPSLTWNGMSNAPSLESVESWRIEPCRTLT